MMFKTLAAAAALTCLTATAGNAAIFDFAKMADDYAANNGGQEGTFEQLSADAPGVFTVDGVTITGMNAGVGFGGPVPVNSIIPDQIGRGATSFFDSNVAGLGVCSTPSNDGSSISGCSSVGGSNPSDDNLGEGEFVDLFFNTAVKVVDLLFRDANHKLLNGLVQINFSNYEVTDGKLDSSAYASINANDGDEGSGSILSFDYAGNDVIDVNVGIAQFASFFAGAQAEEYYVSSIEVAPVPLPASILLLGAAVGGLGLAKRRKKAA